MDAGESPYDMAVHEENRARVEAALRQVPEPFRTTLILRDIEGFVYEEVAEIQGVNLGTVKSRLVRGRAFLKALLITAEQDKTIAIERRPWVAFGRGGAMSSCSAIQTKFSEYLDGRMTGREMQRIAAHLDRCPACAGEWRALRRNQAALASLGPVPEPKDLVLRIRVAVSRERARRNKSAFAGWTLAWRNTVGPFLLQAAAGFASAVLLLGTVTVLVGMFTQPESAQATKDVPLGNATAPRLLLAG